MGYKLHHCPSCSEKIHTVLTKHNINLSTLNMQGFWEKSEEYILRSYVSWLAACAMMLGKSTKTLKRTPGKPILGQNPTQSDPIPSSGILLTSTPPEYTSSRMSMRSSHHTPASFLLPPPPPFISPEANNTDRFIIFIILLSEKTESDVLVPQESF